MDSQDNPMQPDGHEKRFRIFVNGQEASVTTDELTYDEIVALAFNPPPSDPNVLVTVVYRKAAHNAEGTLVKGQVATIKNGTIFDATKTTRS